MIPQGWDVPLARFKAGEISPEIALTLLLLANSEADLAGGIARLAEADPALQSLAALATAQRDRITRVQALVASGIDPAEASVAATRAHFDRLAAEAPEAAVALYSFGDPDLLAAATAELVEVIAAWTDLAGRRVLDFGCGIGRVSAALAPRAGEVVGIDLSERMIAEARARTVGLPNVRFESTDGAALPFLAGRFDLILAVDSYPYLVRAVGFRLVRAGEQPFRIWNGAGFQLVRE
jgi:SAM-dependent methyltransferase